MKKGKIKNLCICLLSALLLLSLLFYAGKILMPKYTLANSYWPTTASYHQFYRMEKNTVDVLFLGSSVCVNAFSPQELYDLYQIRSYNLGSEQQSLPLSYFWLKEALRSQKPKAVVLDVKFCYPFDGSFKEINMAETMQRKCIDPMRWSPVKRQAIREICAMDPAQSESSYYFPNKRFHDRWKKLSESDFNRDFYENAALKGQGLLPFDKMGPEAYDTLTLSDASARQEMLPKMREYLDRIVLLCKENDIDLILVNLPGNIQNDGAHNTIAAYAAENDIALYDFCEKECYEEMGAVLPREKTADHANIWGAVRVSEYIGKILQEKYGVPAVKDEQYETTKEYYAHMKRSAGLPYIGDLDRYLDALQDKRYSVFISAKKEDLAALTESQTEKLRKIGLTSDFSGEYYTAAVTPEKITEKESIDPLFEKGTFRRQRETCEIVSDSYASYPNSQITINGTEYPEYQKGIHIVVYDNELLRVVDSAVFQNGVSDTVPHFVKAEQKEAPQVEF